MNFKDILVHIDNSRQCATRLELAMSIAKTYQARLTGLYIVIHEHYQPQGEGTNPKEIEAEEMFRQKTAGSGVNAEWVSADWGVTGVDMVEILNYYAHQKDLIIVGQTEPGIKDRDVPADLPERIVLGSGRPVLVVPYTGSFSSLGERVIVAWKAGRASGRAVNDAMPFLVKAENVAVLSIKTVGDQQLTVERPDGDICAHLKLHDVNVKDEHLVTGDIPVANILMNYAWENGYDLIVMGAYAHTSRGKLFLGPVAKQLLENMTLPVLMSH